MPSSSDRRPPPRPSTRRPRGARPASAPPSRAASRGAAPSLPPLVDAEIRQLQALLDALPAPLDPLDVSMLDGFLCGVLVQPQPIASTRWLPHVTDVDGRSLPRGVDAAALHGLVLRRHGELAAAIAQRRWFDPWVFELADDADSPGHRGVAPAAGDDDDLAFAARGVSDAALPWVAGIATAFELFPALTDSDDDAILEPLALLYRHLDPDDLEDADALLAEIESLEPATELGDAIEGMVRAVLLLADAARDRG